MAYACCRFLINWIELNWILFGKSLSSTKQYNIIEATVVSIRGCLLGSIHGADIFQERLMKSWCIGTDCTLVFETRSAESRSRTIDYSVRLGLRLFLESNSQVGLTPENVFGKEQMRLSKTIISLKNHTFVRWSVSFTDINGPCFFCTLISNEQFSHNMASSD